MALSLFGKRSPEAHGLHLTKLASPFIARIFALSSECGLADENTLMRATVLSIALANEMFVHSENIDRSRWPGVRIHFENELVKALAKAMVLTNPNARVDLNVLARKVQKEAQDTSESIVGATEIIEKVVKIYGPEEGMARFFLGMLGYLWPDTSREKRAEALQQYADIRW